MFVRPCLWGLAIVMGLQVCVINASAQPADPPKPPADPQKAQALYDALVNAEARDTQDLVDMIKKVRIEVFVTEQLREHVTHKYARRLIKACLDRLGVEEDPDSEIVVNFNLSGFYKKGLGGTLAATISINVPAMRILPGQGIARYQSISTASVTSLIVESVWVDEINKNALNVDVNKMVKYAFKQNNREPNMPWVDFTREQFKQFDNPKDKEAIYAGWTSFLKQNHSGVLYKYNYQNLFGQEFTIDKLGQVYVWNTKTHEHLKIPEDKIKEDLTRTFGMMGMDVKDHEPLVLCFGINSHSVNFGKQNWLYTYLCRWYLQIPDSLVFVNGKFYRCESILDLEAKSLFLIENDHNLAEELLKSHQKVGIKVFGLYREWDDELQAEFNKKLGEDFIEFAKEEVRKIKEKPQSQEQE